MNVDSSSESFSGKPAAAAHLVKGNDAGKFNSHRNGSNGHDNAHAAGDKMAENSSDLVARPNAVSDRIKTTLDVSVDTNIEKAMRVLKRKLIREGIFKELKTRRYFEKPCERKKRKHKESVKRVRKEEARQKKFANGIY